MLDLARFDGDRKVLSLCPEYAVCPRCSAWAYRNEVRTRPFWTPSLEKTTICEVEAGCYICPKCPDGNRWFMLLPADFQTSGQYSLLARSKVVELMRDHRLSAEAAAAVGRRMLNLPVLHPTTVLDWFRDAGAAVDMEQRTRDGIKACSGQIAVDEVYDDKWYQIKVTDPINQIEIAWKLSEGNPSEADVESFFRELKQKGLLPQLVVTDGSNLYPGVIARVWPDAKHQRCVFHFMKQLNKDLGKAFWAVYKTMPAPPTRKAGRPKRRGRPRKDALKRANRQAVRDARFLFVTREENLNDDGRRVLGEAIGLCLPLGTLRRFVRKVHELFGPSTDSKQKASARRRVIVDDREFKNLKALIPALKRLEDDELWARLTRYLDFENADKTSNNPERENREFRNHQKAHYRLRSEAALRSLLSFLTVRRPVPEHPQRLLPRKKDVHSSKREEDRKAA